MGRLKSEYGRRYLKPSWQTYVAQYQEKVEYCTQRRQLEHRHQPFDWQETDSDTSDDEETLPAKQDLTAKHGICNKQKSHHSSVPNNNKKAHVEAEKQMEPNAIVSGVRKPSKNKKSRKLKKKLCEQAKEPLHNETAKLPLLSKPEEPPSHRKTEKLPQLRKAEKPPFIVYGLADEKREVGRKQTHNVKASMSNRSSVYPGALSAHMRQQVIEEEEARRRQKARKPKVPKLRHYFSMVPPKDNWQTEYQSNFSH
ncbi:centriole, cilia and spindle-associated protein-like [Anneissia japonica]|uniref:centriole, cilia and spindle-associated protein-like n=1 Tax=Anneissia japonica TaxID=1529436 RepID=UPI0014256D9A|nr:centriole, cilia and spindle-associated protein-like [Anneissia japonica]